METDTRENRMRKLLNELEMHMDLGYGIKPFGRFVNTKDLEPILQGLRKEVYELEKEKINSVELVKEAVIASNEG